MQGIELAEVEEAVVNSEGPKSQATKADYVKFHDDKTTYTGVYAKCDLPHLEAVKNTPWTSRMGLVQKAKRCRGGPTTVDGQKDLSSLADRTPADARGVPTTTGSAFHRSH